MSWYLADKVLRPSLSLVKPLKPVGLWKLKICFAGGLTIFNKVIPRENSVLVLHVMKSTLFHLHVEKGKKRVYKWTSSATHVGIEATERIL